MSTHVRIGKDILLYKSKAPFVKSGHSIAGALEYSKSDDTLRCHECGLWFESLAAHVKAHNLNARQYKIKHGLRIKTSLVNERMRLAIAKSALTRPSPRIHLSDAAKRESISKACRTNKKIELMNKRKNCPAQILSRLQSIRQVVGHTPTYLELQEHMLPAHTLVYHFGSIKQAMQAAGLSPRDGGPVERYTNEQLLHLLRRFEMQHGRRPVASDCTRGLLPSKHTFYRRFGSFTKAVNRSTSC